MSDAPVNLNKVRKQKARAAVEAKAAENRARFGRTKAERQAEASTASKTLRNLDGHKRDP